MKLEQQVVNLKLSKKLKKLNVKQESLFWWLIYPDVRQPPVLITTWFKKECSATLAKYYSAFTVAELGELLRKEYPRWCDLLFSKTISDKTEVNARAKTLIYLIEKKLIKLNK